MTPKNKNRKKSGRKNVKKTKILEKNSRQLRGRGFPKKKQKKKSEDPSGSIRDITAHLIHDKNTSIALSCTVFKFPSAGNAPGWIYWSYEFLFFRPRGLWTWRRTPAQTRPRDENPASQRFEPIILCSFSWRCR